MEASAQIRDDGEQTSTALMPLQGSPAPERVVEFATMAKDKLLQSASEAAAAGKRDWSSALDLVTEAFEAIRLADERAAAAEEYQADLVQRHADQVRAMEGRLTVAERRADVAENRAKVAEGWLSKFHDTIIDEFQRTFVSR
jgi:hypothetical protein